MDNPKLLPLAILYANDQRPVEGVTKMQKLVFMAQRELEELGVTPYKFNPHDYGPFSKGLYDDLDELVKNGYVKQTDEKTAGGNDRQCYKLTDKGERYIEKTLLLGGNAELRSDELEQLKQEYNEMPLLQLLKRVYRQYPDMATNSKLNLA